MLVQASYGRADTANGEGTFIRRYIDRIPTQACDGRPISLRAPATPILAPLTVAATAAELKKSPRNFQLSWQSAMALALADIAAIYKRAGAWRRGAAAGHSALRASTFLCLPK